MYKLSEKLRVRGVESLTDEELLMLLLGEERSEEEVDEGCSVASNLLNIYSGSLSSLSSEKLSRLRMVEGVGLKSATRIIVAAELGRRVAQSTSLEHVTITNSADVVAMFRPIIGGLKHEECWVLYLNASNRVVEQMRVSQGGVTATVVDHRLIVKRALELLAMHIVVVHNHPSGAVNPSEEDISLTKKIKSAAALFDISLIDHIILAPSAEFSFLRAGVL